MQIKKSSIIAAMAGISLSDYLLTEINEIAERPALAELHNRMHRANPSRLNLTSHDC